VDATHFTAKLKPSATIGIGATIAVIGLVVVVYGIRQQRG
jgi:hypothetical protein